MFGVYFLFFMLGPCHADNWLNAVKPVIEKRIQKYDM